MPVKLFLYGMNDVTRSLDGWNVKGGAYALVGPCRGYEECGLWFHVFGPTMDEACDAAMYIIKCVEKASDPRSAI